MKEEKSQIKVVKKEKFPGEEIIKEKKEMKKKNIEI